VTNQEAITKCFEDMNEAALREFQRNIKAKILEINQLNHEIKKFQDKLALAKNDLKAISYSPLSSQEVLGEL
jgi:predicted  nucleic acid-binding Zn-ribbon protein